MKNIIKKIDEFEREWRRHILAATQPICWLAFIPMVMYATPMEWFICLIIWQLMTLGGTTGYHRVFSHGHWKDCPAFGQEVFFALWCNRIYRACDSFRRCSSRTSPISRYRKRPALCILQRSLLDIRDSTTCTL